LGLVLQRSGVLATRASIWLGYAHSPSLNLLLIVRLSGCTRERWEDLEGTSSRTRISQPREVVGSPTLWIKRRSGRDAWRHTLQLRSESHKHHRTSQGRRRSNLKGRIAVGQIAVHDKEKIAAQCEAAVKIIHSAHCSFPERDCLICSLIRGRAFMMSLMGLFSSMAN
jgi:hypothetical protein